MMIVEGEIRTAFFKTCPSTNMSINNLTRTRPGSNRGFRGDRTDSNLWGMAHRV